MVELREGGGYMKGLCGLRSAVFLPSGDWGGSGLGWGMAALL